MSGPAATAASELAEQAQALDKPQRVANDEGEWNLVFSGRMQRVTRTQLDDLRTGFATGLRAGLDRATAQTSFAADVTERAAWDPVASALRRAESELNADHLAEAALGAEQVQASAQRALESLVAHREDAAANVAVPTPDWTRKIGAGVAEVLPAIAAATGIGKQAATPAVSEDPVRARLRALMRDPVVAERIASKAKKSSVEGALYEEFLNVEIPNLLRTGEAANILPGRDTSKLTFVPGYQLTDTRGRGYSDGVVVDQAQLTQALKAAVQQQKTAPDKEEPAATVKAEGFAEAKAGGSSIKDLSSTPFDPKRDKISPAAEAADEAERKKYIEDLKRERGTEMAAGKKDARDKLINTEKGGQVQQDYERAEAGYIDVLIKGQIVDGQLEEGIDGRGLRVRLDVSRVTTTAIIATPQGLTQRTKGKDVPVNVVSDPPKDSDTISKLKSYGLSNVTHLESGTTQQAIRDVANEYRAANPEQGLTESTVAIDPPVKVPAKPPVGGSKPKSKPGSKAKPAAPAEPPVATAPPPSEAQIEFWPSENFMPVVKPKPNTKAQAPKKPPPEPAPVAKQPPPVAQKTPPAAEKAPPVPKQAAPRVAEAPPVPKQAPPPVADTPPVPKQAPSPVAETPPVPQQQPPTNEEIETELRRGRERPWERPSSGPIEHVPSSKSQFRGGLAEAIAYTIGDVLNTLNEWNMERDITEQVEAKQAEVEQYRREHPYDGVMVIITIERWDPDWRPQEAHATRDLLGVTLWKGGRTEEESMAQRDMRPSFRRGTDATHRIDEERRIWIKPLKGVKPHDWIGGIYTSAGDTTRAIDLNFSGEGMLQVEAWRVDRPPFVFKVDGIDIQARLATAPGAPPDVHIRASFADPLTNERWKSLFTLRSDGALIEEATNPDGLRHTYLWRRDSR